MRCPRPRRARRSWGAGIFKIAVAGARAPGRDRSLLPSDIVPFSAPKRLDAKQTPVGQVMTGNPVTVKPDDRLEGCMAMMAARGFRHLPVLDAGKVAGVISIGDVVKDIIRDLEHNVDDLMGYIMKDGPGG